MKRTALLYITETGRRTAERLLSLLPPAEMVKYAPGAVSDLWQRTESLVFIMASGIAVRAIAPLLRDKRTDPGVVVLDEAGKHAVSLAGGHLGGANDLARQIASFLGGEAVITTASDVHELPSLDLWARDHGLVIENGEDLPQVAVRYIHTGTLRVYSEISVELPEMFLRVMDPQFADVIISRRRTASGGSPPCNRGEEDRPSAACRVKKQLRLRPVDLVAGIGCNRGTSADEIGAAVEQVLAEANLSPLSLQELATIDRKAQEPGLRAFAGRHGLALTVFSAAELNTVEGVDRSEVVFQATGAHAVAEPAALLAAGAQQALVPKQKKGNVTVALAIKPVRRNEETPPRQNGTIHIVGTGPGSIRHLTPAAREAITISEVIVGYKTYLDLISDELKGKEVVSTGMTQEVARCRRAIEMARQGKTVAIISGGDPGVYAMAGLVFELLRSDAEKLETVPAVEVIPGISALNAAASRLGAPLMHDFACISLSDRLTPWDVIAQRLEAAAAADFVIVLYNPRSKGRPAHLNRAREIILRYRSPRTVVGIVTGAMREQEKITVTDLANMQDADVDMQTTVIIGNAATFTWNNLMITPRGYERTVEI